MTLVLAAIMWSAITVGPAAAQNVTLTPLPVPWQSYIGIDWDQLTGELIVSRNYVTPPAVETGNVVAAITPSSGAVRDFSSLTGTLDELKIATVRSSSSPTCQQFPIGTVFTANGQPGEIVRIKPDGTLFGPALVNGGGVGPGAWVTLPGEIDVLRGSFFVDRSCVFGGDLIVVSGNGLVVGGLDGHELGLGDVWRVKEDGTATLIARVGVHLEGVITLPNDPKYGPWAGKIIAGAENVNINLLPGHPGNPGTVYAIGADGSVTPYSLTDQFGNSVKPEDIDLVDDPNGTFFGVAFQDQKILTAPSAAFTPFGDILITQEFPYPGTTGLNVVRWDGTSFFVTALLPLPTELETCAELSPGLGARLARPCQWEHVTFVPALPGHISIVKTPDGATFLLGDVLTFTIVVTSDGPGTAQNVTLNDPLPTTGGLTWGVVSTSVGSCSVNASQVLSCSFGNLAAGASATVVVGITNAGGAPASACTGTRLINVATASATGIASVQDSGDYICQPSHISIVKTPDAGTFVPGDQLTFTIVVTSSGPGTAQNVVLTDPLPITGGLTWAVTSITPALGTCAVSATQTLSCNFGNLPAGATRTVVLQTNNSTGAPVGSCNPPNVLTNLATVMALGLPPEQDTGSYTCACRPKSVKKTKENEFLPKCKGKGSWFDAPRSSSLG